MGRRPKQTFLQRRHTDGQQAHEKMFNITNYQRSQYEEGSCTHSLKKKGKEKKDMHKVQNKELLATCKSNLQKGLNSHQSNDHQQKVYKL